MKKKIPIILSLPLLFSPNLLYAQSMEALIDNQTMVVNNKWHHRVYQDQEMPWNQKHKQFNEDWPTLLTIGDSITAGWYDKGHNVSFPYGYYAAKEAELNYSNISIPGACLVQASTRPIYIYKQVYDHQELVKKASVITILIGINDYLRGSNIEYAKRELNHLVTYIKSLNPEAKIIGLLPLVPYMVKPAVISKAVRPNKKGDTLLDYYLMEENVYRENNIPFISLYELGFKDDGVYCGDGLHPTPEQHYQLGQVLGEYLALCRPQLKVKTKKEVAIENPLPQASVQPPVYQDPVIY